MENFKEDIVQFCSSLGQPCGIALYTEMLCASNGLRKVKNVTELNNKPPEILHIQHEFGIMPAKEISEVLQYCRRHSTRIYVTLHGVIPSWRHVRTLLAAKLSKEIRCKLNPDLIRLSKAIGVRKLFGYCRSIRRIRQQQMIIKYAEKILVHLDIMKQFLIDMGADPNRIVVLDHPVQQYKTSPRLYSDNDNKMHIGCFGFLQPRNHYEEIMHFAEREEGAVFHMYASCHHSKKDQKYAKRILQLAKQNDNIHLITEHLPLEDIVLGLSRCDVNLWYGGEDPFFCCASGSIRQYLAAKRPILAIRSARIGDLQHVVTMVLPENICRSQDIVKEQRNKNRALCEYVEKHTWESLMLLYG